MTIDPDLVAWLDQRTPLDLDDTASRRELVLDVIIRGDPIPKARARTFTTRTKRGEMVTKTRTPTRTRDWESLAHIFIKYAWRMKPALDWCLEVDIVAVFERPERLAFSPPGRLPYGHDPDKDNIEKAVLDALSTAGVWTDDCRVSDGRTCKRYAAIGEKAHVHVRVFRLDAVW